jgi:hypothetical protein
MADAVLIAQDGEDIETLEDEVAVTAEALEAEGMSDHAFATPSRTDRPLLGRYY